MEYNPEKIEKKWRGVWERKKLWRVDIKKAKRPYYNLWMFPYPSGEGLHMGHAFASTGSDIHGRFMNMNGHEVFQPIGYDAFGIHAENYAIKVGVHPKVLIEKTTKRYEKQLKSLGHRYDWTRVINTSFPEYYKWTQWLFLQLYKSGLAYRAKSPVDWCPSCKTVLADEQVIAGKCERCSSDVLQKETEQWFFRITKYADRLLKNLETIDWSERTKIAQRNWIGKSEGTLLQFPISNSQFSIEVFTTRPDTLFGATYMVLAPEHPLISNFKNQISNWSEVQKYIENAKKKNELERAELAKEKSGVELKRVKAINPANKEEMPVFIADYVLASYGTGAIMAVPAHDERDFEFAQKFNLPIRIVVCPYYPEKTCPVLTEAYVGEGHLVASGRFDGMTSEKARQEITNFVGGVRTARFHLRDWLISRQRYWGPPIPIVYCAKCGIVPVPEKDLPVELPFVKEYRPQGTGKSPLASVPSFVKTKCPQCKGPAERETDVSDTFLDSAWYFFRYPSVGFRNTELPWNTEITKKWLPVDMYIGGQEHAVLHLLYTRFITMVLHDLGFADFEEPFKKFRSHGLLTRDGAKMSKSKGNVVNPDEYFKKYGADTVRMYLMFLGPFAEGGDWSGKGIVGIYRFLNRIWSYVQETKIRNPKHEIRNKSKIQNPKLETLLHKTIKKVTEDLENLRYNTAIASLMEYSNAIQQSNIPTVQQIEALLILLAPLAPHITEELWNQLGHKDSVHNQPWPAYDSALFQEETIRIILQIDGKVRDVVELPQNVSEKEVQTLALKNEKIQRWMAGKQAKRIIFVPGKLLNIVL